MNNLPFEKFEVKTELMQAVLQYLSAQPYREVVELIGQLQQCRPVFDTPRATMPAPDFKGDQTDSFTE